MLAEQPLARLHQQQIASELADAVIDLLEAVDLHHQSASRDRPGVLSSALTSSRKRARFGSPVSESKLVTHLERSLGAVAVDSDGGEIADGGHELELRACSVRVSTSR